MRKLLLLLMIGLGSITQAHNLDINQAAIELEDRKALVVVTPPSAAFKAFDDNHNGLISVAEVKVHRQALNRLFDEQIKVLDEHGDTGQLYFSDIIVPGAFEGQPVGSNHLRFMRRYEWPEAPQQIQFRYGLASLGDLVVIGVVDGQKDTVILKPNAPKHTFGKKPTPHLSQFFGLGLEHILTGYDHLLFLLALILAAGRLRPVLGIVTAFTVAHSITLALTVLGVVSVPSYLIEGVIALSIAFVALENLWRGQATHRWRWLVVFAFGLVHGMGFAGALEEIGLGKSQLLPSVLTFNLGVETGQVLFVLVASALIALAQRFSAQTMLQRWGSVAVAAVALYWSAERFFF